MVEFYIHFRSAPLLSTAEFSKPASARVSIDWQSGGFLRVGSQNGSNPPRGILVWIKFCL
jgi:hypothetical protein